MSEDDIIDSLVKLRKKISECRQNVFEIEKLTEPRQKPDLNLNIDPGKVHHRKSSNEEKTLITKSLSINDNIKIDNSGIDSIDNIKITNWVTDEKTNSETEKVYQNELDRISLDLTDSFSNILPLKLDNNEESTPDYIINKTNEIVEGGYQNNNLEDDKSSIHASIEAFTSLNHKTSTKIYSDCTNESDSPKNTWNGQFKYENNLSIKSNCMYNDGKSLNDKTCCEKIDMMKTLMDKLAILDEKVTNTLNNSNLSNTQNLNKDLSPCRCNGKIPTKVLNKFLTFDEQQSLIHSMPNMTYYAKSCQKSEQRHQSSNIALIIILFIFIHFLLCIFHLRIPLALSLTHKPNYI